MFGKKCTVIGISPKFVTTGTIDNKLSLVQVIAWHWTGTMISLAEQAPNRCWCSGPFCYLLLSMVTANARRHYLCNISSYWLRPCSAIDRKWSWQWSIMFCLFCIHPANERRHYIVTSSLIGWVHALNSSCVLYLIVGPTLSIDTGNTVHCNGIPTHMKYHINFYIIVITILNMIKLQHDLWYVIK